MFFVNGKLVTSDYPNAGDGTPPSPATFAVNQMFVHFRGSERRRYEVPIIFVHGGGLTGMSWETTPDGREGWATYFTREGFDTYVVDLPGRGRSGFNVTPLNQAKVHNNPALQPSIPRTGIETAWVTFRFGETYGTPYADTAFPVGDLAEFSSQGVPNAEVTLGPSSEEAIPAAIAALLDRTGPAILVAHSQAGRFADATVALRPTQVQMVVHLESNCPQLNQAEVAAYARVAAVLYVHGDHIAGNPAATGQPRLELCTAAMNVINAGGGRASLSELPSVGLAGNSHLIMQDRNNLEVADWLIRELRAHGLAAQVANGSAPVSRRRP
jgi:pimeloyl-ACP methyl ester carboxylesterase